MVFSKKNPRFFERIRRAHKCHSFFFHLPTVRKYESFNISRSLGSATIIRGNTVYVNAKTY